MQQHPVPQPITTYEFRLVGDMTLKQFGKLASGVILALIVYGVNPPTFIKWPLIVVFAGAGILMAFVPFNGRPVDAWFLAFFRRIYSPTLYLWQAKNKNQNTAEIPKAPELAEKKQETPPPTPVTPEILEMKTIGHHEDSTFPTPVPPLSLSKKEPDVSIITEPVPRPKPSLPFIPKPPLNAAGQRPKPKVEPLFLTNMTLPTPPSMANIIVGYVHTPDKKIIDGAIIEIRESQGIPVRALKTNQLGQFQTATPLPNGSYEIELEKEGYSFDIIKVNLTGQKIPPIEIISKSSLN